MQSLEALVREARDLAARPPALGAAEEEVARQMTVCNACRYCEGFCAVFSAAIWAELNAFAWLLVMAAMSSVDRPESAKVLIASICAFDSAGTSADCNAES